MSNELFENPKVALGFAGVVIAIALVASVAFEEFSSGEEEAVDALVQEQAPAAPAPAPAAPSYAASTAPGWGDDDSVSDDWGVAASPVSPAPNGSISELPPQANEAGPRAPQVAQPAANRTAPNSNGPMITTSVAPGVPDAAPPQISGSNPTVSTDDG